MADEDRVCANCGDSIDTSEWFPVVSDAGDDYELHSFCDESCRDEWLD